MTHGGQEDRFRPVRRLGLVPRDGQPFGLFAQSMVGVGQLLGPLLDQLFQFVLVAPQLFVRRLGFLFQLVPGQRRLAEDLQRIGHGFQFIGSLIGDRRV